MFRNVKCKIINVKVVGRETNVNISYYIYF